MSLKCIDTADMLDTNDNSVVNQVDGKHMCACVNVPSTSPCS